MSILIVGSESLIGGALMLQLERSGKAVLATARRQKAASERHIYLDLLEDISRWKCPAAVGTAVICAGITSIEACRRDPVSSTRVNVEGTSKLIEKLVAGGVLVIYLSSDKVFEGSVPYRMADDKPCPVTEYGRQKAEAELRVSQWGGSVAIVRLTKVLSSGISLFSEWVESLKKGRTIHPFSNMVMAPIPLSFAVSVLRLVEERCLSGIIQVSGGYDVSYAQAAYRAAKLLGVDSRLVQSVEACPSGPETESLPAHATLNADRLKSMLKIEPPDVWWTIEKAFVQPHALDGAV